MRLTSMILPRNLWLLAASAGLGLLLLLVRPPAATERAVIPLFPNFEAADVMALTVETPMDGGVEAEVVHMVRESADAPWTVQELFGAPAGKVRVSSLLSWIGTMTDLDIVSAGSAPVTDYGLGEGEALKITFGPGLGGEGGPAENGPVESGPVESGPVESGIGGTGASTTFFAAPASGGGAFVRLAGTQRVARVPQFPLQTRGPLSWFERDSLVPLESIQIRKVAATGSALPKPITVALPDGIMNQFVDGAGNDIPAALALELFRSLRATFPDGVIALPEPGSEQGREPALHLEITPAVGKPFQVTFTDLGDATAGADARPGIAFRSDQAYGVEVNARAVENVMKVMESLASKAK